ncbi:MAG: GrrA/OscA1 family cyclophane-containing rSAM-modified RiPP [Crocosphaera sp.]
MPVNNQSGYLSLVLMLATLTVEMSPAKGILPPHPETVPQRVERIQKLLQETSVSLKEQSSKQPLKPQSDNETDLAIWADWADGGRRRGGSGGWVDAWGPGWGDWADTPRWADWGDVW